MVSCLLIDLCCLLSAMIIFYCDSIDFIRRARVAGHRNGQNVLMNDVRGERGVSNAHVLHFVVIKRLVTSSKLYGYKQFYIYFLF